MQRHAHACAHTHGKNAILANLKVYAYNASPPLFAIIKHIIRHEHMFKPVCAFTCVYRDSKPSNSHMHIGAHARTQQKEEEEEEDRATSKSKKT